MKIIIFLTLTFSVLAFAGPMKEISTKKEFEAYLKEVQFNGVLLVQKENQTLFRKAMGYKNFETLTPLKETDIFQMGSVTKQFVAASILRLQDLKRLSIDDDVTKYLPEKTFLKGISIRDLLNHTSGIANYTDQQSFWQMVTEKKQIKLTDIIDFLSNIPFNFSPKSKWEYSNSGYIIAGRIVEVVSGLTWDEFIREHFLQPLNMKDTGYSENFNSVSETKGYQLVEGKPVEVKGFNMSWALSAGALYTTMDDLAKWTQIYDSSSLLSFTAKKEMQTPFKSNYGLGVIVTNYNSDIKIHHNGRTPGFQTELAYLKGARLKVVKLDNIDGGLADMAALALDLFAKGKGMALKTAPFKVDLAQLSDYAGEYLSPKLKLKVYLKDDNLFLFPEGQSEFPLTPNDVDSFRLMGIAGEEFIRDSQRKVVELRHYQNGSVTVFKKIN